MDRLIGEVRSAYEDLFAFVSGLERSDWDRVTAFYGWTVWDEIAHLMGADRIALAALNDPDAFKAAAENGARRRRENQSMQDDYRNQFGHLDPPALLEVWRSAFEALLAEVAPLAPDKRLPWMGPDMSARSFASARHMEVFAHGQDIYDVIRRRRVLDDSIRNIVIIGVNTFGWTYATRKMDKPPAPRVELIAPSGELWIYREDGEGLVRGPAEDFCLVVTQRRHVDDTELETQGAVARQWMELAQCFAGPPADGPAPGVRKVVYA